MLSILLRRRRTSRRGGRSGRRSLGGTRRILERRQRKRRPASGERLATGCRFCGAATISGRRFARERAAGHGLADLRAAEHQGKVAAIGRLASSNAPCCAPLRSIDKNASRLVWAIGVGDASHIARSVLSRWPCALRFNRYERRHLARHSRLATPLSRASPRVS